MLVTMNEMQEFGALIKSARLQRGWTQTELASRIGYGTHNVVLRMERGDLSNPPDPPTMRALEKVLGIPRQKMLEVMGYLDPPDENAETITVRRDDPRGALLARLMDLTDDEVQTWELAFDTFAAIFRGNKIAQGDVTSGADATAGVSSIRKVPLETDSA